MYQLNRPNIVVGIQTMYLLAARWSCMGNWPAYYCRPRDQTLFTSMFNIK